MDTARTRPQTQAPPIDRPSAAVPELLQRHFDELHTGSGLSVATIKAQGYFSACSPDDPRLSGYAPFSEAQRRLFPALVLPVHAPDGSSPVAVLKPDRPRTKADGTPQKYEWPARTPLRVDVPVACLPHVQDRRKMRVWEEGNKKAVKGAQDLDVVVLNLNGIYGWKDKKAPGGILPDVARLPHAGCHEVICFDSHVMRTPHNAPAIAELVAYLRERGAVVSLAQLPDQPDGSEMKLDDYLLTHNADDFFSLIAPADGQVSSQKSFLRTRRFSDASDGPQERPPPPVPPFPVRVLPEPARTLVAQAAASCDCPPEFVALPLLAIAGGVIGRRLALHYRRDWFERPILWTAVVGHPGTAKSPALERAREPMESLQEAAHKDAVAAHQRYEAELEVWGDRKGDRGPKPHRPPPEVHYYTSDATAEAINRILGDPASRSPGLTVVEDELTRWVAAFDAYRGGKGGDRQKWLSLWAGGNLKTDRASRLGEYTTTPVVCVTGGIQPDRLGVLAADAGARDGFTERFLYAWPDARAPRRGTGEVTEATVAAMMTLLADLRGAPEQAQTTRLVPLSDGARAVFDAWYDENAGRTDAVGGYLQGVYAKLPRQVLRLALVLHALAHGARAGTESVGPETMRAAVELAADYFTAHAFRVLSRFGAGPSGTAAKVYRAYQEVEDPAEGAALTQVHDALGRHVPGAALRAAVGELCRLGLLEPGEPPAPGHPGRPPERFRTVRRIVFCEETPLEAGSGAVVVSPPVLNGHAAGVSVAEIVTPPAPARPPAAPAVVPDHVAYVTDAAALERELPALLTAPALGVDTETTGLDPLADRLRLIQLATGERTVLVDAFAVDVGALAPVFAGAEGPRLVFHNAGFDLRFLLAAGLPLPDGSRLFDSLLAERVGDRGEHFGKEHKGYFELKAVAQRVLGVELDKTEQTGDWGAPTLTGDQLVYAVRDAEILLPLAAALQEALEAAGLWDVANLEFGAVPVVVWTEHSGVPFDVPGWVALAEQAEAALTPARAALTAHAQSLGPDYLDIVCPYPPALLQPTKTGKERKKPPRAFNPASGDQLRRLLAALGVDVPNLQESTLAANAHRHPVVADLLAAKRVEKFATTFGLDYLEHVHPATGRLHGRYFQLGTRAGRMSAGQPNVQQLPGDPRYRACVTAPEGRALIKCDYSQIELRIIAEVSGDDRLIAALNQGADLHQLTAATVFGVPVADVTPAQRAFGKTLNFGVMYGMGARRLVQSLAEQGVTLTEGQAREYIAKFNAQWHGVERWRRAQLQSLVPVVSTVGGRERVLEYGAPGTERVNTPIQGTGADVLKAALAELWATRHVCPSGRPILLVHDEIVIECDAAEQEAGTRWVTEAMVAGGRRYLRRVAVEAKASPSRTWGGSD